MLHGVGLKGLSVGAEIAHEPAVLRALLHALERRERDRGQETDNRNYHHYFDESESSKESASLERRRVFHDRTQSYPSTHDTLKACPWELLTSF